MWNDLFAAMALVLVLEGIMPFVAPGRWREAIRLISQQNDRTLRTIGFMSMLIGALLLYVVR